MGILVFMCWGEVKACEIYFSPISYFIYKTHAEGWYSKIPKWCLTGPHSRSGLLPVCVLLYPWVVTYIMVLCLPMLIHIHGSHACRAPKLHSLCWTGPQAVSSKPQMKTFNWAGLSIKRRSSSPNTRLRFTTIPLMNCLWARFSSGFIYFTAEL